MGMPWIRVDTNMFDHPKLLALRADNEFRAIVLHLQAMCYTGEYDLDGYVPASCLAMLTHASAYAQTHAQTDAQTLLNGCLWVPQRGGYSINGWQDRQSSTEEAHRRSERARIAAQARWANRNGHDHDAH